MQRCSPVAAFAIDAPLKAVRTRKPDKRISRTERKRCLTVRTGPLFLLGLTKVNLTATPMVPTRCGPSAVGPGAGYGFLIGSPPC